jgi:hypothetical protein
MLEKMVEYIGYLASVLIAISITIKGGFYFRILNMIGSIFFMVYGFLIGSWTLALINIYGIGINIFHLVRNNKR